MSRSVTAAVWTVIALTVGLLGGALAGYFLSVPEPTAGKVPDAVIVSAAPISVSYSGTGAFRVPGQLAPGTYLVTAGSGDFGCYWERVKSWDNRPQSVLSSGDAQRGGYGRLVVTAKDVGVRMVGDCTWRRM